MIQRSNTAPQKQDTVSREPFGGGSVASACKSPFGVGGRDIVIVPGPVLVDECRNGDWSTFDFPRGFKNEGDCKQFVNSGK